MELETKEYDYDSFTKQATGRTEEIKDYKIVSCPFDKYEIKVKLTPNNEFLEIVEVSINRDFLSHKQRMGIQTYIDVDAFYRE